MLNEESRHDKMVSRFYQTGNRHSMDVNPKITITDNGNSPANYKQKTAYTSDFKFGHLASPPGGNFMSDPPLNSIDKGFI